MLFVLNFANNFQIILLLKISMRLVFSNNQLFKVSITTVAELSIGIDECKLITSEKACILFELFAKF